MKRDKTKPSRFRAELAVGDVSMPLESALAIAARQLRALAAIKTAQGADDEADALEAKALLAERDARHIIGQRAIDEHTTAKRSKGGKITADKRRGKRQERKAKIHAAVAELRKGDPTAKKEYLAQVLHERGFGGKASLLKLIR